MAGAPFRSKDNSIWLLILSVRIHLFEAVALGKRARCVKHVSMLPDKLTGFLLVKSVLENGLPRTKTAFVAHLVDLIHLVYPPSLALPPKTIFYDFILS